MLRRFAPRSRWVSDLRARVPWAGLVIAAVAAGTIYGFYRNDPSQSTNEFLYRWQTGLAGIGAVLAAYLTVHKMEKTDANAERRHIDLIALQLQGSRVSTQRAITALEALLPIPKRDVLMGGWFSTLPIYGDPDRNPWRWTSASVKQIVQDIEAMGERPLTIGLNDETEWGQTLSRLTGLHHNFLRHNDQALALVRSPIMETMKQLIGPEVDLACDRIEKAIAKTDPNFQFAAREMSTQYTFSERWVLEPSDVMQGRARTLDGLATEITRELEELSKSLQVQLDRYPVGSFSANQKLA